MYTPLGDLHKICDAIYNFSQVFGRVVNYCSSLMAFGASSVVGLFRRKATA